MESIPRGHIRCSPVENRWQMDSLPLHDCRCRCRCHLGFVGSIWERKSGSFDGPDDGTSCHYDSNHTPWIEMWPMQTQWIDPKRPFHKEHTFPPIVVPRLIVDVVPNWVVPNARGLVQNKRRPKTVPCTTHTTIPIQSLETSDNASYSYSYSYLSSSSSHDPQYHCCCCCCCCCY